jgi:hypothetical protein
MFDTIYGEQYNKDLSFEEFKDKYYDVIELGNKSVKESFAILQLQSIIENKDYNQIDTVFQLYLV